MPLIKGRHPITTLLRNQHGPANLSGSQNKEYPKRERQANSWCKMIKYVFKIQKNCTYQEPSLQSSQLQRYIVYLFRSHPFFASYIFSTFSDSQTRCFALDLLSLPTPSDRNPYIPTVWSLDNYPRWGSPLAASLDFACLLGLQRWVV